MGKLGTLAILVFSIFAFLQCSRPSGHTQNKTGQPGAPAAAPPQAAAITPSVASSAVTGSSGKSAQAVPSPSLKTALPQNPILPSTPLLKESQPQAQAGGQAVPFKAESGLQALLTIDRDKLILPEDFKIGPLSGSAALEGDEKGALASASSFLEALEKGRVDQDFIAKDSATALSDSLSYYLEQGDVPKAFRIGKPKKPQEGEIAFNVRLFGPEGSAEGEIYLDSKDRHWVVSDFQLTMAELKEKREKSQEKFFPSSYRWLLGE